MVIILNYLVSTLIDGKCVESGLVLDYSLADSCSKFCAEC